MSSLSLSRVQSGIFPIETTVDGAGHLTIGGCTTTDLAAQFGTPLYVFDEATLRAQCRSFLGEFRLRYPATDAIYACKAFINKSLLRLLNEEGMGLDVVSGGELHAALAVDFPPERIYFHGNNKSRHELEQALQAGIGRIVVDNLDELALLSQLATKLGRRQGILLRVTPGIDPHTHRHTTTGVTDSKFGLPLASGMAASAVRQALASPSLDLLGLHCPLGSPIFEVEPYAEAVEVMAKFAADMQRECNFRWHEFSPGGGFAVQYVLERPAPPPAAYAQTIASALRAACRNHGLPEPRLIIEPGRAIVGRAGVALYTVGEVKDVPSVRTYVAVDGGMGDNIRPAIYGARYEAVVANRVTAEDDALVTICGKYCESGDVLVSDILLPQPRSGDLVAIPTSGAYCLAMSSQYNANPRPAVVMVRDGQARLIRRRETYADLIAWDTD